MRKLIGVMSVVAALALVSGRLVSARGPAEHHDEVEPVAAEALEDHSSGDRVHADDIPRQAAPDHDHDHGERGPWVAVLAGLGFVFGLFSLLPGSFLGPFSPLISVLLELCGGAFASATSLSFPFGQRDRLGEDHCRCDDCHQYYPPHDSPHCKAIRERQDAATP